MRRFPLTRQQIAMLDFIGGRVDDYYLMVETFHVSATLDVDAFGTALASVMDRHDVIRSSYPAASGEYHVLPMSQELVDRVMVVTDGWTGEQDALAAGAAHVCAPLDLAADPPLRVWLGRLTEGDFVVLIGGHHLVFDAWSFMLLYEDLATEYRRAVKGGPDRRAAVQYADAQAPSPDAALDEWRDLFDHPYTAVRALQARAATQRGPSAIAQRTWPGLGRLVTATAKAQGVTPYVIGASAMLTALAEVLGDQQVVFGTADAGRRTAASVNAIGYYSTTLFVGADLARCGDVVRHVDTLLRRWHQAPRIQWEDLLAAHGRQDLYPIKFAFQPADLARPSLSLDGVGTRRVRLAGGGSSARRPIDVIAAYDADAVEVRMAYRTDTVRPGEAEQLIDCFGDALRARQAEAVR